MTKTKMITHLFILLFFFLVNVEALSGPHIADVNILLPPKMTHPVDYRLQGSDGCFKWTWDHHDVLSVVPEYNESSLCSTSARLRSIAPYSGRKETAVYATDILTGIVIRVKVYIDMFSRIQIFHNSVKLDLDDLATLRVHAFDSQENVFSSLVGLRFMWTLMPESNESSHHLIHVPLRDSRLGDSGGFCGDLEIQMKLEDSDAFSDLFVVKGIEIGHDVVSVRLFEPRFDNMTDKIVLTVAEAMSLDPPSPVLLLPGAFVRYSLKVIRENVPQVVQLPSSFHRWAALNSSVAEVDVMLGSVQAANLGETTVIVEDIRVAGHVQTSSLIVCLPDYISLYLLPLSASGDPVEGVKAALSNARWHIVSGRQYLIELEVFSRGPNAREIYITKNEDVKLYYDQPERWKNFPVPDHIFVKYGWKQSRILEPISGGLGELSASLSYSIGHTDLKERHSSCSICIDKDDSSVTPAFKFTSSLTGMQLQVLRVVQEVMVCDQVKIIEEGRNTSSPAILLPWSPDIHQELELYAVGGCANAPADYKWLSSDSSILSLSSAGVVQARRPGKATVKAVSIFDDLNFAEVVIEVAVPSSMVVLPNFPVETVVGSYLQAAVAMKAPSGDYFYRCDAFSSLIKWSSGGDAFTIVNSTREPSVTIKTKNVGAFKSAEARACSWTYVHAISPGRAILQAAFSKQLDLSSGRQILLKASSPIASFLPLIVHQVGDGNHFGGYWIDTEKAELSELFDTLDNLYLAPGTHMDVKLLGGPERWGGGVDFVQTVDVFDELSVSPKDGALVKQVLTSRGHVYRIMCQVAGDFTLVFKRGNLIGEDHAQPVVPEAKLGLLCSFPSSIVLLADEPVNKVDSIQTAIQADRGPGRVRSMPITVANGRTIRVSAVGLTDTGKAFANSSSLSLAWELNNCDELAFWDDAYNFHISRSGWEGHLALRNASGLCTVRAVVQDHIRSKHGYTSSRNLDESENALADAIRLQVVSELQVFPESVLLFVNPEAKMNLSAVGGSCFLDTSVNDSRVVEVMQPTPGLHCSQLTLVPRTVGNAVVTVHDIGLSLPLEASALVKVADIDWLKIVSGEEMSLMEGSIMTIDLLAGINDGNTFEPSQYRYMKIRMHVEDQIVQLVDGDVVSPGEGYVNSSRFSLYGRRAGVTTVYVSATQQSGQDIFSQIIKLEVYTPPLVHPPDIFLVPGASYMLTVKGGPRFGVGIEFASDNDTTVVVEGSSGQLSAVSPGNSSIVATFYGNGRTVLCQAFAGVRVGVPAAALLNVQSEQLGIGREMPIFPLLLEGNLFSFYELCKNYKWTIEDEKVLSFHHDEIVNGNKLRLPSHSSYAEDEGVDFMKVLYGRSAGRSNVALTFTCVFSSSGSLSKSRSYSASVSIRVVPDPPLSQGIPITWILPPHYTTSDLLPEHSETQSKADIRTQKGDITYSVLQCCHGEDNDLQKGALSIHGSKITTFGSNKLACIQAKDLSTGRTEVASCVRVTEVAQVRIQRKLVLHQITLAVGAEIELPIKYYDGLGNPFVEAHDVVSFAVETNYPHILSLDIDGIKNSSMIVKAMCRGRALLMVRFNDNPQKSDYIMVSVGAHIHPQNPVLHPGRSLNFAVEGLTDQASGQWSSANTSVISVDPLSGKAVAVAEGTAIVGFQSSQLRLQTSVKVLRGDVIYVDAPQDTLTNILSPAGRYNFSVKYSSDEFGTPGESIQVPYVCKVDPSFVGYTKPWRDLDTGDSFCLFFPHSPEHLARSLPKAMDRKPDISISIHAALTEASDASGSASALFVGGFSILDMDKENLQLNLTPGSNTSILTIVGNTDVGIHWLKRDLLSVKNVVKEGSGIGALAQYEVKVLKAKPFRDRLIFTLPASGQRVEMDVIFGFPQDTASNVSNSIVWVGVVCLILFLLTVIIYVRFLDRPNRSPSISPPAATVSAPQTPERSSPTLNESSPRTPQPFIEYVRRTIDETPYYRREGRRRFDTQNTY